MNKKMLKSKLTEKRKQAAPNQEPLSKAAELPSLPVPQEKASRTSFLWLFIPLISFLIFGAALFVERMGLSYRVSGSTLEFLDTLPAPDQGENQPQQNEEYQAILLYDSAGVEGPEHYQTVSDTLTMLNVAFEEVDVRSTSQIDWEQYPIAVIAFVDLNQIESQIQSLDAWIEAGGRVLFSIRPDPSTSFQAIYRKMGIQSRSDNLVNTRGILMRNNLMPILDEVPIGQDFLTHNSLAVRLEPQSKIYAASADDYALPLVWEYEYGDGLVIVINSDHFTDKSGSGFIAAVYSLLQDAFVYPVINSSVYILDGFPGPLPGGRNESITQQFGRDIQSFFINIWWPDLKALAQRYGLKYSGMLIEAYNENIDAPFYLEGDIETYEYLGGSLLDSGGEIGIKGYNQIPLCLEQSLPQNSETIAWQETDEMARAFREVHGLISSLYPQQPINSYLPPAGIVCNEALDWLADQEPALRVISGIYLPNEQPQSLVQNFEELDNGLVAYPRVTSGYIADEYQQWLTANVLMLYYANSHTIDPIEVLNGQSTEQQSWTFLRDQLSQQMLSLNLASPGLRSLTLREGGMAVQRYERINSSFSINENTVSISIDDFVDEAWFLMRSQQEILSIQGAEYTTIAPSLYLIEGQNPEIIIELRSEN